MDHDETHSNTPSEPFHTIPIYQPDASSSDSDSNDNNEDPVNLDSPVEENKENVLQRSTTITSVLQHRPKIQPPPRSFTEPVPRHERHPSELSAMAESIQTRPSVEDALFFEEEEEEEDSEEDLEELQRQQYQQQQQQQRYPSQPIINVPKLTLSPSTQYQNYNNDDDVKDISTEIQQQYQPHKTTKQTATTLLPPTTTTKNTKFTGLLPLNLLSGDESSSPSYKKSKHELSKENLEKTHRKSSDRSKRDSKSYDNSMRGIKKEMSSVAIDDEPLYQRDSADLLPLTLVAGGGGGSGGSTSGGLSFSSNYAYLSPPFGSIISRSQILARVAIFSQLILFNIIYASYKLSPTRQFSSTTASTTAPSTTTTTVTNVSEIVDGKDYVSNLVGLVILPCLFLILYLSSVTIWTYIDLKNKGFDSSFTVAYYSPLMLFSIFYGEKKRVDVSKFHEVNYGAKWWRFGTSKVREGIIMSIYCIFIIGFVTSDIISRALNESNLQVSKVFEDFVPFLFMLIIFSSGFFIFIWTVVDPVIDGTLHGSGEGKKRLIGVLPNAFKSKRV